MRAKIVIVKLGIEIDNIVVFIFDVLSDHSTKST